MANDRLQDELRNLLKQNFIPEPDKTGGDSCVSEAAADAFKPVDIPLQEQPMTEALNIDFDNEEKKVRAKGEAFMEAMYKFYLDYGLMSKPEYLEQKKKLDGANISNIFGQIQTTKLIMKGLLGELTRGNMNPRLVESYCTLNNQLSDMIKAQANYILFLEESWKKSKIEAIEYNTLASEQSALAQGESKDEVKSLPEPEKKKIEGDYFITSDTKTLMDEIQRDKDMYSDDAHNDRSEYLMDDKETESLTNPMNKDVLIDKYNVDKTLLDDENNVSTLESSIGEMF